MMWERMFVTVRVFTILDALKGEQGSYRLGEIQQWTRVSRATCDRQLRKLVNFGVLNISVRGYKGAPCRYFSITEQGRKLLEEYDNLGYGQ